MIIDTQEYRTVVLASLLHDIGKMLQRGSFGGIDIKGKHPAISADFVSAFHECFEQVNDLPLLKTLVQKHHESHHFEMELNINSINDKHVRALASIVSLADNLSSAERGEQAGEYQDYKETPLASVLERINNTGLKIPSLRFHAASLSAPEELKKIFPEPFQSYNKGELTQLIKDFGEDFSGLFKTGKTIVDRDNFDCVLTHIYSLLAKYAWCLPSNTQEVFPDVSLFDHLRTTSAIASCLYLYHQHNKSLNEKAVRRQEAERFLLVAGDISGIQNYIFDISSIGSGGVARRLRARSMYVQLCSDVATHLVLRKLGLPVVIHTLMNSGGHFYLLLPNLDEVVDSINDSQREIDSWFLKQLNGEMALNLAHIAFGDDGFQKPQNEHHQSAGFGNMVRAVNERLDGKKKNHFASQLQPDGKWQEAAFKIPLTFKGEESCQSCHKFPQEAEDLCAHCRLDREVGACLPDARVLYFYDNEESGDIKALGYSISINHVSGNAAPYLASSINNTDLTGFTGLPAVFKYVAKTVPAADDCDVCRSNDSKIATFECIAGRAHGNNLLGFLKMDVDNLGETVIFGLKPDRDSVSRTATFSRMLDAFFAGYVEGLAKKNRDIYVIFSGGDDLLLAGPWDLILETAECIRRDFLKFSGNPKAYHQRRCSYQ
jgi:CRISPR-associated protein Csm1